MRDRLVTARSIDQMVARIASAIPGAVADDGRVNPDAYGVADAMRAYAVCRLLRVDERCPRCAVYDKIARAPLSDRLPSLRLTRLERRLLTDLKTEIYVKLAAVETNVPDDLFDELAFELWCRAYEEAACER